MRKRSLWGFLRYTEEIPYYVGGESLEQVIQRSCGCCIPGGVGGGWTRPWAVWVASLPMAGRLELDNP